MPLKLDDSIYKMNAFMCDGLREQIRSMLDNGNMDIGRSATGQSIVYAVEWAQEHGKEYRITGGKFGYHFELIEPIGG